jgi:hypothetical protein
MTLAHLFSEIQRLRLRVSLNGGGPTPVLNVEPKDLVTPELEQAFRTHQAAIIAHLGTARPSIFTEVRAVLAGLPTDQDPPALDALAGPLRHITTRVADVDALTRQLIRAEVITALDARKVRGAAKIVDAAFTGIPLKAEEETAGRRLLLEAVEPWPEPVDGAALLDELTATFTRYVILPSGAAETLAAWCVHAHALEALDLSPYLALTSPEKRCGKTTTLTILAGLVPRAVPASNITAAALFRAVEKYTPTLLVDEADTFLADQPELRGILNSGHTRATAWAIRTVGEAHEAKTFSTFCPKVIALIRALPATLEDRSIVLALRRKTPSESVERIRLIRLPGVLGPICRRAARWAADHLEAIRSADPAVPAEIVSDRAQDNWRPLLAIGDLAGGPWPDTLRKAACTLSGQMGEDTGVGVQLLADLRDLFDQKATDSRKPRKSLFTRDILTYLHSLEERPWPTYDHGKPLTPRQLSDLLRPFGGRSKPSGRRTRPARATSGTPSRTPSFATCRIPHPWIRHTRHKPTMTPYPLNRCRHNRRMSDPQSPVTQRPERVMSDVTAPNSLESPGDAGMGHSEACDCRGCVPDEDPDG